METISYVYQIIVIFFETFVFVVFPLVFLVLASYHYGGPFIHDKKATELQIFGYRRQRMPTIWVLSAIGALIWPIVLPCMIFWGALLLVRAKVRMKKKLNWISTLMHEHKDTDGIEKPEMPPYSELKEEKS